MMTMFKNFNSAQRETGRGGVAAPLCENNNGGGSPDNDEQSSSAVPANEEPMQTESSSSATATCEKPKTAPPKVDQLPPWKVLLHNDDLNDMLHVVDSILMFTSLSKLDAVNRMMEAHMTGVALLLTTHKERAELYLDQFKTRMLTVTIEPAE